MEPSRSELQTLYSEMDAQALHELAQDRNGLTPEAGTLLLLELQRRSLAIPPATDRRQPHLDESTPWITVERFRDLSAAIVARSALQAAAGPCFLRDENTVRMDWQISNFVGGMRLQVPGGGRGCCTRSADESCLGRRPGQRYRNPTRGRTLPTLRQPKYPPRGAAQGLCAGSALVAERAHPHRPARVALR